MPVGGGRVETIVGERLRQLGNGTLDASAIGLCSPWERFPMGVQLQVRAGRTIRCRRIILCMRGFLTHEFAVTPRAPFTLR
ncbi:hypothetical protein [Kibdelosporangium philippinense]|uniref:hypothetical protein n=1 Tax=Kibdelosporangium philippinense TaxID=211113 RepID=UPI003605EAD1